MINILNLLHRIANTTGTALSAIWRNSGLPPLLISGLLLPLSLLLTPIPQTANPITTPIVESQRMQRVGQLGGLVSAVTTDGVTALVAEGDSLLRLDISDDNATPVLIDRLNLERGSIQDVLEAFPMTYVLTEEGLLVTQGIASAPLPQPVNFLPGGGQALAAAQDNIYVAARDAGLRVIDISTPQQPRTLANLELPGQAQDVVISGNGLLALVAAGEAGLHVVSVQNPGQAQLLGTIDDALPADAVAVNDSALGPLAYVGSGPRLYVLAVPDVAQPDRTQIVGLYSPLSDGRRMTVSPDANIAYVADGKGGLRIFDVSTPGQILQIYADPLGGNSRPAFDVALSSDGDFAYVAAGASGLRIVDVSNPFTPVDRFVIRLAGSAEGLAVSPDGRRVFVALGANGLAVLDVATTQVLNTLSIPAGGQAHNVVAGERWAYVAAGEAGVLALRVDSPGVERLVASLALEGDLAGTALDLTQRGDLLFVAGGAGGLYAIDVIRPTEPRLVAQLLPDHEESSYQDITVIGKRAYIADGQGLIVADVAAPERMGHLARRPVEQGRAVALDQRGLDAYAYLLSDSQVTSYEVTISSEPLLLGVYHSIERISKVVASGDRLLLTNAESGPQVMVLNVSNPRLPREEGYYGDTSFGSSLSAAVHGDTVLVAGGLSGLIHLSFDDDNRLGPTAAPGGYSPLPKMTLLSSYEGRLLAGGEQGWSIIGSQNAARLRPLSRNSVDLLVRALAQDGQQAVVSSGDRLLLFDVSDPLAPELLLERQTVSLANGVAMNEDYIFVADADRAGGLEIFSRAGLQALTRVSLPAAANDVALDPNHPGLAFLSLENGSLAIVDVAIPTGGLRSLGWQEIRSPALLAIAASDGRALALSGRELALLDTNRAAELALRGQGLLAQAANKIALHNQLLYVLTAEGTLNIHTLDNLASPTLVNSFLAGSDTLDMVVGDGAVFLAKGQSGLAIIAIDADQEESARIVDSSESANALLLDGDTLYSAGTALTLYDLTSNNPAQISTLALNGPARHIALVNSESDGTRWLYVSTVNGIDVVKHFGADNSLELVTSLSIAGGARQVVGGGNRTYVAQDANGGGLLVLSSTDFSQPQPLFTFRSQLGIFAQEMLLINGRLLVSWERQLELLDVSNPASPPALLATIATGGQHASDVTLAGDFAYVSMGQDGVAILDISQPTQAQVIATLDTPGLAQRSALSGDTLFVADGPCGVRAIDVSDPNAPVERGFWLTSFSGDVSTSTSSNIVFAANGNALLALRYLPDADPVPPPTPANPSPSDGATGVTNTTTISWGPPQDPCNPLRYEISLGVQPLPSLLGQVSGEPRLEPGALRGLSTYYWQVRAIDLQGDQSNGPVWSFTTARSEGGSLLLPAEVPLFDDFLRANAWAPIIVTAGGGLLLFELRRRWRRRGSIQDESQQDDNS